MKKFFIILSLIYLCGIPVSAGTTRNGCPTQLVNSTNYRHRRTPYRHLQGTTVRCNGNCHARDKNTYSMPIACIPYSRP